MLQKYIIKLNQCWHKQSGATPRMWGESIKDSCSVLIPYQFQQVGRRAALLGQGPFQQSLPVLVFLTHTWGESKWVFFSSSNNRSASAPSFTLSDLRGAHRFHENATANKFLRDSQIALPGKTFWCIDKINKTIYCAMLKFKTAGALLGATLISCLLSLLKGLFIHNLFVPEVSREEQRPQIENFLHICNRNQSNSCPNSTKTFLLFKGMILDALCKKKAHTIH